MIELLGISFLMALGLVCAIVVALIVVWFILGGDVILVAREQPSASRPQRGDTK